MATGEQLEHLDERLREVTESLAVIGTSVKTLEGQVSTMNKALFQGNGHPSLMTRVEILELGQTKKNGTEENRTLIVVERWKAITAIVTALVASPVLVALIAALLNK